MPRNRKWADWEVVLLGNATDTAIARKLGRSVVSVAQKRRLLGIPHVPDKPRGAPKANIPEQIIRRLGKCPDSALAAEAGVSPCTIASRRVALGIPKFTPGNPTLRWRDVQNLSQPAFFAALSREWEAARGRPLNYNTLSALTYLSVSGIQKFFTAGSAQRPLPMPVRHHMYLAVCSGIATMSPHGTAGTVASGQVEGESLSAVGA